MVVINMNLERRENDRINVNSAWCAPDDSRWIRYRFKRSAQRPQRGEGSKVFGSRLRHEKSTPHEDVESEVVSRGQALHDQVGRDGPDKPADVEDPWPKDSARADLQRCCLELTGQPRVFCTVQAQTDRGWLLDAKDCRVAQGCLVDVLLGRCQLIRVFPHSSGQLT